LGWNGWLEVLRKYATGRRLCARCHGGGQRGSWKRQAPQDITPKKRQWLVRRRSLAESVERGSASLSVVPHWDSRQRHVRHGGVGPVLALAHPRSLNGLGAWVAVDELRRARPEERGGHGEGRAVGRMSDMAPVRSTARWSAFLSISRQERGGRQSLTATNPGGRDRDGTDSF